MFRGFPPGGQAFSADLVLATSSFRNVRLVESGIPFSLRSAGAWRAEDLAQPGDAGQRPGRGPLLFRSISLPRLQPGATHLRCGSVWRICGVSSCAKDVVMAETTETNCERTRLRLDTGSTRKLERATTCKDSTVSRFVLHNAFAAAEPVIEARGRNVLPAMDRDAFHEVLLHLRAPNAALRRAARRYREPVGGRTAAGGRAIRVRTSTARPSAVGKPGEFPDGAGARSGLR